MPKGNTRTRKLRKQLPDHRESSKADKGMASDVKLPYRPPITYISAVSSRLSAYKIALTETLHAVIDTRYNNYLFWAILVLASLPITLNRIECLDAWFHIHYGRVMLETMSIPDLSQSYFMPIIQNIKDFRFTFLGDIILYIIHNLGGDIGIQIFKIGCILFCCYLLLSIDNFKYTGWSLLILIFFVLGTYQKQLIRNSLFGLPFTVFLLWLFIQIRFESREKLIWIYPPLLGLWGIIHGSYLFGFCLMVLLFLGDIIDSFRKLNTGKPKYLWTYPVIVLIAFGAIYVKNPLTHHMLIAPIHNLIASVPSGLSHDFTASALASDDREQQAASPPKAPTTGIVGPMSTFDLIKQTLNNTVFKSDPEVLSHDFTSPFNNLRNTAVPVSLAFGILAAIALLLSRPCRCSILFPFIAVSIFGLGYMRVVGDITILSAWTLLASTAGYEDCFSRLKQKKYFLPESLAPWLIAFVWTVFVGLMTLTGNANTIVGPTSFHIVGFGRVNTFDDSTYDHVLQRYENERVFTTISTGSYALYRWYPNKKVFIDGLFAPHDPQEYKDALRILRRTEDPDILYRKYQIEVALVESTSDQATRAFRESENWYPVAIGLGATVFQYFPEAPADGLIPEVLFDRSQVFGLPERSRRLLAAEFYRVVLSFYSKGRVKDGFDFMRKYIGLYQDLRACLPEVIKKFPDELVDTYELLEKQYGMVNDKGIRYDYLHATAIAASNPKDIVLYGMKLAERYPRNKVVNLKLANAFVAYGKIEEAFGLLGRMEPDNGEELSQEFKSSLAQLYAQVGSHWEANNNPAKAYQCYARSHHLDARITGRATLHKKGTELYQSMNKAGRVSACYEMMKSMLNDFQEDSSLLYNLAFLALNSRTSFRVPPETALGYALRAAAIMEKERDGRLYAAYNVVSEAYLQTGSSKKALAYAGKALSLAPEEAREQLRKRVADLQKVEPNGM